VASLRPLGSDDPDDGVKVFGDNGVKYWEIDLVVAAPPRRIILGTSGCSGVSSVVLGGPRTAPAWAPVAQPKGNDHDWLGTRSSTRTRCKRDCGGEWEAEVARSGKDPVGEYLNMARQHLDDSGAATRYALIAIAEALRDIRDVIKKR
jgi:hypothetical protein